MLPVHFEAWQAVYGWFQELAHRLLFQTVHHLALMLDLPVVVHLISPTSPACKPDWTAFVNAVPGSRILFADGARHYQSRRDGQTDRGPLIPAGLWRRNERNDVFVE